ncbi:MAG: cytidine deaminase [Blautia sp.]|nr:cytidine deaminase [Eubacteriales bacterium]MED9966235.1 cytidine deaminase [Blautia sp.]
MEEKKLIELAHEARKRAYTPYSGFQVGAALLTKKGKVYLGCNIENASYTPTNCAERTAFFKAVSEGEREFAAIAIVGGAKDTEAKETCAPCGVCRQVMREFCDPQEFRILLEDGKGGVLNFKLAELLPLGFGPENLAR